MRILLRRHLLLLGLLGAVSGCAALVPSSPKPLPAVALTDQAPDDGLEDYVGVLHVHTTYSHDAHGTFADVVRVANAQGLDYVILTEHNTLQPLRDGQQGWHGAVLVLVGVELSTPGGHYLALNVAEEIDPHGRTTQAVIDDVNRQGGMGFIAHPYFRKRRWTDWDVRGVTGIEVYNVAHDTLDENRLRLALWTLTVPPEWFYLSLIDRPYDPLEAWEEMIARHGRFVGIGATDAHEFHLAGLKFASYEILFQIIRTHVLVPSPSLTPEGVYEALRQGHTYLAIELTARARGFSFVALRGKRLLGVMGDDVALQPDLVLRVTLPAPAELTLLRDGRAVHTTTAAQWQIPVTQPGVYRLEAMRHGTPWIFSNPIYVRAPEEPARKP